MRDRDEQLEGPMPHSAETERAVLGAMMLDGRTALEAAARLTPADFYVGAHALAFRALREIAEGGEEPDPLTVGEALRRDGVLERVGGLTFLSQLTFGVPGGMGLAPYYRILRDKALKRQLVRAGNKITSEAAADDDEARAVLSSASEMLSTLSADNSDQQPRKPLPLSERLKDQQRRHELMFRGVSDALPTGFDEIDAHLLGGGLQPKQFVILAARPSVGKTSLMLDIAANVSASGRRVLAFSLEMGAELLIDRLASFAAGVERWKIRPGIWQADYDRLRKGTAEVCSLPVYVDDSSRTISAIRRHVRDLCRRPETRPDLVLLDYIQLVDPELKGGSLNERIGAVSAFLKGMGMEHGFPVLALSQLSRDCEKQGREPELSDLRDSGTLEQDGDLILALFGDRPEEGARLYERTLKCLKQKDGPLFRERLIFNGPLVSFRQGGYQERANAEIPFNVN
jgi:replicative DNA helicase